MSVERWLTTWMNRIEQQDREARVRKMGCDMGLYEWYSLYHPFNWCEHVEDENGLIEGKPPWFWYRRHKLECFHQVPRATLPFCGAKTRAGGSCRARVVSREDGTLARRCRLHGGLSTGAKTKAGRAAIVASNKRRAKISIANAD